MVKGRRYKARGLVAVAAVIVGWHMVRRRHFSSGGYTIVAGSAVINDALMIEPGISKGRRNMAYRAILGSRNVGGIGLGIFPCCGNTIVARDAVVDNSRMIEHSVGECTGYVTGAAIFICCNVGRIDLGALANCGNTIVTSVAAFARNFGTGMINKCASEISGVMAHPAILGSA